MLITKIAATIAIVCLLSGFVISRVWGSPFPNITTTGESVGALLMLVGFVSGVIGLVAGGVWGL